MENRSKISPLDKHPQPTLTKWLKGSIITLQKCGGGGVGFLIRPPPPPSPPRCLFSLNDHL